MSERRVFVELNPFHSVTLFPYYASTATVMTDAIFANERLFGQELFDDIQAPKFRLSIIGLVRFLWGQRIQRCHFNTINFTLNPITWETAKLNFLTLALPVITRLCGCRNDAIVHEADQFFETGIDSCRRHSWFRQVIGRWFIRLFDHRYVLAPEVAAFLQARNICVKLLDPRSLSEFALSVVPAPVCDALHQKVLCWIGPLVSSRRNWRPLAALDSEKLAALDVSIVMLCDTTVGEGPDFQEAVRQHGLDKHFIFLGHRPTDRELFSWVRASVGIVCLYGGREYGTTKTSGARLIACAFQKAFIGTTPSLGVYHYNGSLLSACDTLNECIEHIVRMESKARSALSSRVEDIALRRELQ